jgi:hypothetical protein
MLSTRGVDDRPYLITGDGQRIVIGWPTEAPVPGQPTKSLRPAGAGRVRDGGLGAAFESGLTAGMRHGGDAWAMAKAAGLRVVPVTRDGLADIIGRPPRDGQVFTGALRYRDGVGRAYVLDGQSARDTTLTIAHEAAHHLMDGGSEDEAEAFARGFLATRRA